MTTRESETSFPLSLLSFPGSRTQLHPGFRERLSEGEGRVTWASRVLSSAIWLKCLAGIVAPKALPSWDPDSQQESRGETSAADTRDGCIRRVLAKLHTHNRGSVSVFRRRSKCQAATCCYSPRDQQLACTPHKQMSEKRTSCTHSERRASLLADRHPAVPAGNSPRLTSGRWLSREKESLSDCRQKMCGGRRRTCG